MAIIDNLRVNKDAFEEAINTFENKKLALENTYLKISNEVRTLDGTYHGAASEKFKSEFDAMYKNLQQNETAMSNVIAALKSALETYESHEGKIESLIQSIEEGIAYISQL